MIRLGWLTCCSFSISSPTESIGGTKMSLFSCIIGAGGMICLFDCSNSSLTIKDTIYYYLSYRDFFDFETWPTVIMWSFRYCVFSIFNILLLSKTRCRWFSSLSKRSYTNTDKHSKPCFAVGFSSTSLSAAAPSQILFLCCCARLSDASEGSSSMKNNDCSY